MRQRVNVRNTHHVNADFLLKNNTDQTMTICKAPHICRL